MLNCPVRPGKDNYVGGHVGERHLRRQNIWAVRTTHTCFQ